MTSFVTLLQALPASALVILSVAVLSALVGLIFLAVLIITSPVRTRNFCAVVKAVLPILDYTRKRDENTPGNR